MHTLTNLPEPEMFASVEGNEETRNAHEKLHQGSIQTVNIQNDKSQHDISSAGRLICV